jgi:predicted secreted hydrolase
MSSDIDYSACEVLCVNPISIGSRYPLDWILSTLVGRFFLEPYFDEQTMNAISTPRYWEGKCEFVPGFYSSEQIGAGYMELKCYAPMSIQLNRINLTHMTIFANSILL